ncbi:MAG: hypothetical protein D6714_13550 [Bacteroidetes bacterium]|nr:MAG: hypothetical protein D6714_13550 [Bacteroidota bacterium]
MRVYLFFFLSIIGGSGVVLGQKQANIWYFGNAAGIEFSTGVPRPLFDGKIDAFEGCATICDDQGNLLFYTNGGGSSTSNTVNGFREGMIWNQKHEPIYNMSDTAGGGYSATQSALFLSKPDSDDIIYLFTMAQLNAQTPAQPDGRGLSRFEIDRSKNNGLGAVTLADERIFTPAFEALSATVQANNRDYWLVCMDENTFNFAVFPVTENGVGAPAFYPTGIAPGAISNRVLKISPDGKYLAMSGRLYAFDKATGAVQFIQELSQLNSYAFSFSPQSRYLYSATGFFGSLIRYDLEAPDIEASMETIASLFNSIWVGLIQIGPDGNLYFLDQDLDFFENHLTGLDVIKCPDAENPVVQKAILTFPVDTLNEVFVGLPNFADHIFQHITFEVAINSGEDTLRVCPGEWPVLDAVYPEGSYTWTTGDTTRQIQAPGFGVFGVTVTSFCGEVATDSIWVKNMETDETLPDQIETFCAGDTAFLAPPITGNTYLWSTGDTTPMLAVTAAGQYSVTVGEGCVTTTVPFLVTFSAPPEITFSGGSAGEICPGDTVSIVADIPPGVSVLWSSGDTTRAIRATTPGIYSVVVADHAGCFEVMASKELVLGENCCEIQMPNAFTPDNDLLNDVFRPLPMGCDFVKYRLRIFSRWGKMVFETTDPTAGWDGNLKGKPATGDVYVWTLDYEVESGGTFSKKGELVVLR